ncbi:HIT-like protein [Artomyces pyxidatus]|uniref:HIT-like protein n=1 Tax=Artomyces pyxidatus TaxID=48021 RepID=A0ACB8STH3_9AGAM|nr:HIT-like protein [Artomyces pyxidatus]
MTAQFDDKCLFCLIVKGTIPSFKVLETEHSLAFLDINPVSEGHTLVIPKYHARTIGDLPDEYLAEVGPLVKKVALATGVEQYNILQNNGKLAFQHVDHVHFHVIPKPNEKEGLVVKVEENWPQRKAEPAELAATLEKMKSRLS